MAAAAATFVVLFGRRACRRLDGCRGLLRVGRQATADGTKEEQQQLQQQPSQQQPQQHHQVARGSTPAMPPAGGGDNIGGEPLVGLDSAGLWRRRSGSTAAWDRAFSTPRGAMPDPDWSEEVLQITLVRVILPTIIAFVGGILIYVPSCEALQDLLDIGNTRRGPILSLLGMDQSQFMQNFLTVNGLLFTILCGNTYTSLYSQQERLYHALFLEVSEAKSLLEQASLVCQGRPFYPKVLESIRTYVEEDLRRLDVEPADLLANRPMDDPLEYILYATSVGVPSIIYDTIRDLRQARGCRLGAMQRKLPPIHFALLYVLGFLELLAFPLLGAGTASMSRENTILSIQAIFFGAMCGAIVMTLQVIYELWKPFGGAYTVDVVLSKMVRGLQEELVVRQKMSGGSSSGGLNGWRDPMARYPAGGDPMVGYPTRSP